MKKKTIIIDDLSDFAHKVHTLSEHEWNFKAVENTRGFFNKLRDSREDELLEALKSLVKSIDGPQFHEIINLESAKQLIEKYEVKS